MGKEARMLFNWTKELSKEFKGIALRGSVLNPAMDSSLVQTK